MLPDDTIGRAKMYDDAYIQQMMDYERLRQQPPEAQRMSFLAIPVLAFVVLVVSSASKYPWNYIIQISGAVLAMWFLIRSITARIRLSPEVVMYLAWLLWSMTALIAGANLALYKTSAITIFKMLVLIFIVSGFTSSRKTLTLNMAAFAIGSFLLLSNGVLTGSFNVALEEGGRATGMAMNPNGFGRIMVSATAVLAYFWMMPSRFGMFKYVLVTLGMLATGMGTILSGSRFAILGLATFYLLWIWICYRKEVLRRSSVLLVVVLGLSLGSVGFVSMIGRTAAASRFEQTWRRLTGQTVSGGSAGRIQVYKEAALVIVHNPIFGVGLNNFILYSSMGNVAHSEYTEIAADTGIPGAVIYFMIYVLLWRRAGKIAKLSPDPCAVRIAKLIRVFLLVTLFLGLGAPNYYSKPTWILLASFIGYTSAALPRRSDQVVYGSTDVSSGYAIP